MTELLMAVPVLGLASIWLMVKVAQAALLPTDERPEPRVWW